MKHELWLMFVGFGKVLNATRSHKVLIHIGVRFSEKTVWTIFQDVRIILQNFIIAYREQLIFGGTGIILKMDGSMVNDQSCLLR